MDQLDRMEKIRSRLLKDKMNDQNDAKSKTLASVLFKNTLINPTREEINVELWQRQSQEMRDNIKEALLSMLGNTDISIIKAAGTCVAAIAVIEIPQGQWPEIIPMLSQNSGSQDINYRLASLHTLGFICEDIAPECIAQDSMNLILSALLTNIFPDQIELTQIAMKAFARAAPITDKNFPNHDQKEFIMQKLFEASKINDEDILVDTMQALNDIVRVNYDYIFDYIVDIGQLTMSLIDSQHEKAAQLAIEVWTTIAEVEIQRKMQQKDFKNIIMSCHESIMQIIIRGLSKFDQETQDENLDEMPENNLSLSAGYTLESIARTVGNNVLEPIFNFIQPKIASNQWGDRYIGMIAFGSIIDGPNPQDIMNIINNAYGDIIQMINDPIPKVRQTVAFVYYKLSEFVPEVIFQSQQNLDLFIKYCIDHISEHHLISNLIIGSLKNLFVNSHRLQCPHLLNSYFEQIFTKLVETMYREDINQANELQNVSDAINDITDYCDSANLQDKLRNFLIAILQELSNSVDNNVFQLRLTPEQRENFQNYLGSLCQILIAKLKGQIEPELTANILQLVKSLFDFNQKIIQGGLLIVHALIYVNEGAIETHINEIGPYLVASINNVDDENCGRFACGLVSDLSNYLEKNMNNYAHEFMTCINNVLSKAEYSTDTKLHAMIAVGDICLAIEANFQQYLEETMRCLFSACTITVNPPQNFESDESINKLRDSIIDAFISIIHGMQPLAQQGSEFDKKLQSYAADILHYIDALLVKPNLDTNDEFVKNVYELYADITEYYGDAIRGQMRQMSGPKILRDGLTNFSYIQGMDQIRDRFMSSLSRALTTCASCISTPGNIFCNNGGVTYYCCGAGENSVYCNPNGVGVQCTNANGTSDLSNYQLCPQDEALCDNQGTLDLYQSKIAMLSNPEENIGVNELPQGQVCTYQIGIQDNQKGSQILSVDFQSVSQAQIAMELIQMTSDGQNQTIYTGFLSSQNCTFEQNCTLNMMNQYVYYYSQAQQLNLVVISTGSDAYYDIDFMIKQKTNSVDLYLIVTFALLFVFIITFHKFVEWMRGEMDKDLEKKNNQNPAGDTENLESEQIQSHMGSIGIINCQTKGEGKID